MKQELSYLQTIKMIMEIKRCFEQELEKSLDLIKVGSHYLLKLQVDYKMDYQEVKKQLNLLRVMKVLK